MQICRRETRPFWKASTARTGDMNTTNQLTGVLIIH